MTLELLNFMTGETWKKSSAKWTAENSLISMDQRRFLYVIHPLKTIKEAEEIVEDMVVVVAAVEAEETEVDVTDQLVPEHVDHLHLPDVPDPVPDRLIMTLVVRDPDQDLLLVAENHQLVLKGGPALPDVVLMRK